MNFELVHEARLYPHTGIMGLQSPRGLIHTGVDLFPDSQQGWNLYLEYPVVVEAGRLFGMVTAEVVAGKDAEIASLKATVESLARHLKERDPLFQALKAAISDEKVEVLA